MKVVISNRALSRLESWLSFQQEVLEIPLDVIKRLHRELIDAAFSLSQFPNKGQIEPQIISPNKTYRRIVVRHVKIIYRVAEDHILITDFFDTRQDPDLLR